MFIFSGSLTTDLVAILVGIIVCLVTYYKLAFRYWKKRCVTVPFKPYFPFGNLGNIFLGRASLGVQVKKFYDKLRKDNQPYGGIYVLANPTLVVTDLDLVKAIMQTDFQYFVNHGTFANEKTDPLAAHLFNMEDEEWRDWRIKLTPTFTTGKMKMMLETVVNTTEGLKDLIDTTSKSKAAVNIQEVNARFTTDIIGSVVFGIECNALRNPNSTFRQYGKRAMGSPSIVQNVKVFLQFALPRRWIEFLGVKQIDGSVEKFFINAVKATVEYREQNNIYRKDFMHLLLQLRNRGKLFDDEKIKDNSQKSEQEQKFTIEQVTAQCFLFFVAGFETSTTTSTFALYELAKNMTIQKKLREEINCVIRKYDSKMTYEALAEMHYLDQVIQESLRKYPPLPTLFRSCSKDYQVPGSSLVIERDTVVQIPVLGIQMDPEYYPHPEKFDPERFTEEKKKSRHPCAWLPFGEGPRMCIGLRFGLMQTKVTIATVIMNYEISVNAKTKDPLDFNTTGFITSVAGGVWLDVKKI